MPITPDQFKDLIPAPNTPICPKVIKALLEVFTLIWQDQKNEKNADGSPSDAYKASLGLSVGSLAAPGNVAASDGTATNSVTVTWSAAVGAASYEVWRNTLDDISTATSVGSPPLTTFLDSTVDQDVVYFYWVKAVNAAGTSIFSSSNSGFAANTPSSPLQFSDLSTWRVPTGVTTIKVEIYGGGGSGGGGPATAWAPAVSVFVGGGGGGAGERRVVTALVVTPGDVIGINIGDVATGGGLMSAGATGTPNTVKNNTADSAIATANGGIGGGGGGIQGIANAYAGGPGTGGSGGTGTAGTADATAGGVSLGGTGATGLDGHGGGGNGGGLNAIGSPGLKGFCIITPNG